MILTRGRGRVRGVTTALMAMGVGAPVVTLMAPTALGATARVVPTITSVPAITGCNLGTGGSTSSVCVTEHSPTVSGIAPPGVTGVTVSLLRDGTSSSDGVQTNTVASFTPAFGSGQSWSGSFGGHSYSGGNDLVEIQYSGGNPRYTTVYVGNGTPPATTYNAAGQATSVYLSLDVYSVEHPIQAYSDAGGSAQIVPFPSATSPTSDTVVANFGVDSLSLNGASPQARARVCYGISCYYDARRFNFGTLISAGNALQATTSASYYDPSTSTTGGSAFGTTVTLRGPKEVVETISDPSNSPTGTTQTLFFVPQTSCSAYLVLNEVTCTGLFPGAYTVSNGPASATLTVPATFAWGDQQPNGPERLYLPKAGWTEGASLSGLAAGQTVTLSQAGTTLDTLTVQPLKIAATTPLGDLLNGANTTVSGSCAPGVWFVTGDLCTSGGGVPSPNGLGTRFNTGGGYQWLTLDEASAGNTDVLLPQAASSSPADKSSTFVPYQVSAVELFNDPLTNINVGGNVPTLPRQPAPRPVSTSSTDAVTFAYAPVGSSSFTTLGNVNVAGGLTLPASLPSGRYDGQWTVTDANGDSYSWNTTFDNQGVTQTPGPAAPTCTASGKGITATVAPALRRAISDAKKKKKKKGTGTSTTASATTVTFSCASSVPGANIALWLEQAGKVVADGAGTVKGGKATVTVSGSLKTGTYQLVEVIDANGRSTEAAATVSLKVKAKTTGKKPTSSKHGKHSKHKKHKKK
jgi:hypothetical protein